MNGGEVTSNGKIVFELFPREYIQLNQELYTQYHPKLQRILEQFGPDEVDIKLAQIAAYCEVMLDGDYRLDDRIGLCKILYEKLVLLREDQGIGLILITS